MKNYFILILININSIIFSSYVCTWVLFFYFTFYPLKLQRLKIIYLQIKINMTIFFVKSYMIKSKVKVSDLRMLFTISCEINTLMYFPRIFFMMHFYKFTRSLKLCFFVYILIMIFAGRPKLYWHHTAGYQRGF